MTTSNIIGSLVFCPECGNLLDMAGGICSFAYKTAGDESTKVVTGSSERAFQSSLKAKRHLVQQTQQKEAEAMIKEKCPSCGHDEMAYHTMQLRSADEGQTVFYNCKKCGYKYKLNS
ncbi:hypothetical protein BDF14DRAFT_1875892 [Spinellus fusiger]|nr:hypothetical protein BDF14DRAFT_1875892 [Spinellus fusiger]